MSIYLGTTKIPSINYTTVISNIALEEITIIPSTTPQTVTPSNGKQGFSSVTVQSIPNNYIIPKGTLQITTNGEHNVSQYAKANVSFPSYITQDRTVIPTTTSQTVIATSGYDALHSVTVEAIQTEEKVATTNGDIIPSSGKYLTKVTVNVPVGVTIKNQTKSITPTESPQTVTFDSGYTGLSLVDVGAISSTYIGSDIERRDENDLTISGAKVTIPAGYYTTSISKSVTSGTAGTPTATKGTVSNNQISITPKVTNTTGYITGGTKNGTAVIVSASELVGGTLNITSNGTKDVTNYASVNVNVPSSGTTINNQDVTVTPSESSQSVTADSKYTGLGTVTVEGIPSTYVGSGIAKKSSTDLTISGATVNVPAGYYASDASKAVASMTLPTAATSSATSGFTSKATISRSTSDQYINIPVGYNDVGAYYKISAVANGNVTAPSTISGINATVSTDANTLTLTKIVSVTPNVTTAGYISAGTAGDASISLMASVITKAAATITPGTTDQIIAANTYLTGTQTISGDSNLVGSNIISGASIFGVNGTVVINKYYTGSSAPTSSLGNNGDIYFQE